MAASKTGDARRPARVAARIRAELATAIGQELGDPRLAGVVVAGVEVTDDLSLARVAIVVLNDEPSGAAAKRACRLLTRVEGGLRKRLAPRLGMRRVPTLRFEIDHGRDETRRLDALLHEVGDELRQKPSTG